MYTEIWKDIKGYEGLYQVSNLGNIKSLDRNSLARGGGVRKRIGCNLKQFSNTFGRLLVCLCKYGKCKSIQVSRLVAEGFMGLNRNNIKILVCHRDDNPLNNCVHNLFLGSYKDNYDDMVLKGRRKVKGGTIIQLDKNKYFIKEWCNMMEIQKILGIQQSSISRCVSGKQKSAGGFMWKYKNK